MFRAYLTFTVVVMATVLLGMVSITVGMVLPAGWCFEPLYHLWSLSLLAAAGVRVTVEGAEHLLRGRNYFFVGNHQSAMDIPILVAATRGRVRFMAKQSLFYIPVLGWSISMHGFVPIDRSNARKAKMSTDSMLERLAAHPVSMLVFPEGTRSEDGSVAAFKHGAIKVCQRAALPVVPFAIAGSFKVHQRGVFKIHPGRVHVTFGKPIPAEEAAKHAAHRFSERVRELVVRMHKNAGFRVQGSGSRVDQDDHERITNHQSRITSHQKDCRSPCGPAHAGHRCYRPFGQGLR